HPPEPFIPYNGGRLLKHVDAVTVCWEGDPLCQDRADFAAWMVDSDYFDLLAEYKISRGTARGPFFLPDPAPPLLDDPSVGPLLRAQVAAGRLPTPVADTLYLVY